MILSNEGRFGSIKPYNLLVVAKLVHILGGIHLTKRVLIFHHRRHPLGPWE